MKDERLDLSRIQKIGAEQSMALQMARAAGKEAQIIDQFIHDQLEKHAPFAFFFLSRPLLRFTAPLFRLSLVRRPDEHGVALELYTHRKHLGTMLIAKPKSV